MHRDEVKLFSRMFPAGSPNGVLSIQAPFCSSELSKIKNLTGRKRFRSPVGDFFTCENTTKNRFQLKQWGYQYVHTLYKYNIPQQIPGLNGVLRPFQWWGVWMIENMNGRALLADDMGLGKTVQALAYLKLHPELRPAVVVCPAFLKLNWHDEAKKWLGDDTPIQILSSSPKVKSPKLLNDGIILVNYDILANDYLKPTKPRKRGRKRGRKSRPVEIVNTGWVDYLIKIRPAITIFDEAHKIKNNGSYRTMASKKLNKGVKKTIIMTGTPIENRPSEVYNAITMVNPSLFPSFRSFAMRYCDGKFDGRRWNFNGSSHMDELHALLRERVMIRRLKSDHLKELPPKEYVYVPLQLENKREYQLAENHLIKYLRETYGESRAQKARNAMPLAQMAALRQLAVKGVHKQTIQWIENFLESGEKLILFGVHIEVLKQIHDHFKNVSVLVNGSVAGSRRHAAVKAFQTDPKIKLFIGNIEAAGVGLTLTQAHDVAFVELPWTPGALAQAEDRAHRMTQIQGVTIHFLLAQNTIMDKLAHSLGEKLKNITKILDGGEVEESALLWELIQSYL